MNAKRLTINVATGVDAIRTEAEVIDLIQRGQGDISFTPDFLALLEERHPVYDGVDPSTVFRIRGALIRGLAKRALPKIALPFVLSELESAFDPWLTGVAAAALRKSPEPSPRFVEPLLEAIIYIRHRNDVIRLDAYGGYGNDGDTTTPLNEIFRTLAWLGDCGHTALPSLRKLVSELKEELLRSELETVIDTLENQSLPKVSKAINTTDATGAINTTDATADEMVYGSSSITRLHQPLPNQLSQLRLQDQSGQTVLFSDFFLGQPTVVAFFFTRCGNPAKCPLTISRLGRLQQRLRERGSTVRTAAITYDPAYDDPRRLTQYARSWGARVDQNHRFFRTLENQEGLREFFELGVSYSGTSVNQHQLEAFVLDTEGTIVGAVRRRRLDASEIIAEIDALLG